MANYFTDFSFMLNLDPPACDKALSLFARLEQAMGITSDLGDPIHPVKDELTAIAVALADEMGECLGFTVEVEKQGLWIWDGDDAGLPEHAAAFVQAVLRLLELDTLVVFSWANTCDKPRIDAFGGGALAITRYALASMNTGAWMQEQERLHDPNPDTSAAMISDYLQKGGTHCPLCGCPDIRGESWSVDANVSSQEVFCDGCQSCWEDIYTLCGIANLTQGQSEDGHV